MFTRRACASVRSALPAQHPTAIHSRSFAAGAALHRVPALADITPDSAATFTRKQKEFREGLIAAQKKKEQDESTSKPLHPHWLDTMLANAEHLWRPSFANMA